MDNLTKYNLGANNTYSNYSSQNYLVEESLDIKKFLTLFLSNWYWFAIALFITLSVAYGINRWSEDIYTVYASILIEDEEYGGNLSGAEYFIPGGEIFQNRQNINNEIGILRSYSHNYKVMMELPDFWVTYVNVGRRGIAESRQYMEAPFIVVFDSLSQQSKNKRIDLEILSQVEFKMSIGDEILDVDHFGDQYMNNNFNFRIELRDGYSFDPEHSNRFYFWFESLEGLANQYRRKLIISPIEEESSLIRLTTSGFSRARERDYLNKLMEVYRNEGLKYKNETAEKTIEFITDQINLIRDSLGVAENNLERFRLGNAVMDLSSEASMLQSSLLTQENERFRLEFEERYYDYLLEYIDARNETGDIISPSLVGISDPLLSRLVSDLADKLLQKKKLAYSLKGNQAPLALIDEQITKAKLILRENVVNSHKISTDLLKEANIRIDLLEIEIQKLPGKERQYINIQRNFDLNNTIYNYLMEKRAEAGIAKASNVADSRVIDYAETFNSSKVKPKEKQNFIVALILGLLIPVSSLILLDLLNNKIIDRKDIEKATEIPIIGFIGHSDSKSDIPVVESPGSTLTESFRSIRARLKYFVDNDGYKVITITSTISGEGKTFVSINIASIFAMLGKRVLLVGLDLRKPKLHRLLDVENGVGLSSYLMGEASYSDIILETTIKNLDFVPSGPVPPNPAELIESGTLSEFFSKARKDYDYIILDTPPVAIVTDTLLLIKYADVNLFIVRQRYSSKNTLELINDLAEKGEFKNLSILVNDISLTGYYGYGLRYGNAMGYKGYNYGYNLYGEYGYRRYGYGDKSKDYYS